MSRLPIDAIVPEILQALRGESSLVIEAPPGAGKTTRVPLEILRTEGLCEGEIVVLQPRRLAARLGASFVASQLGEPVGKTCGYQVRFDSQVSNQTRLRFVTEGVLSRQLRDDPQLNGVGVVVFDEFHERHLEGDVNLALLRRLQASRRSPLKLIAMSATLDAGPVAQYLGARVLRCEGRAYPVEIDYMPGDDRPLPRQVLRALHTHQATMGEGHILVFLPGMREIQACLETCTAWAKSAGLEAMALYGDLGRAEQDRVVGATGPARRLIFTTNVAETSITIDGVCGVVDAGLAREASYDPWSGLPQLRTVPISQASAIQRAGRAGRTRAGHCVRLYSRQSFESRPSHTTPEIRRLDLASTLLDLTASGVHSIDKFEWFEPPAEPILEAAKELLVGLGAIDADSSKLTEAGRKMVRLPLHPRHAKILIEAQNRGLAELGAKVVALLNHGPVIRTMRQADRDADADVFVDLARIWGRGSFGERVDTRTKQSLLQVDKQLRRALGISSSKDKAVHLTQTQDDELRTCLLAGFFDRVGKLRDGAQDRRTLVFARGGSAELSPASVLRTAKWAVALAAEDRRERTGHGQAWVRSAAAIELEWLLELFPERITESVHVEFDAKVGRVKAYERLLYEGFVIEQSESKSVPAEAVDVLRQAAVDKGVGYFVAESDELEQLRLRSLFATQHSDKIEALDEGELIRVLGEMCGSCSSFKELKSMDLLVCLKATMDKDKQKLLDRIAPSHVAIPGRKRVPVHYEVGREPWIEGRIQDFYGQMKTPTVANGKVPLVLHLLAPNRRAVQVSSDLVSFWERHYPKLRNQLMRKYSRHFWPEDPRNATPPEPRVRRPRRG